MKIGFKLHFEDTTVFVDRASLEPVCTEGKKIYKTSVLGAEVTWSFEKYGNGEILFKGDFLQRKIYNFMFFHFKFS